MSEESRHASNPTGYGSAGGTGDGWPVERPGPVTAGSDQQIGGAATGGGWPPADEIATSGPEAGAARRPRPTDLSPEQLGFTPRRPVGWLGPVLLAGTAVRVALAELFGAYLDKRELQSALPATLHDERPGGSDDAELWIDYVADLGDGFNATYSVAYLIAQPELDVGGGALPRGRVLVMGGDQVYPTPSGQQYEDRFEGPYRAALPEPPVDGDDSPTLYALPGNHDWYDGLTAFLRLFTRSDHAAIGGWRTRQTRSYFALQLPHGWWLFAIDAQFGAYLDDPQLRYFRDAASRLRPGDRVIVCPPAPGWVAAAAIPGTYDTIDFFVRTVVEPTGAEVRLMISGDLHHYARYHGERRELITCGGGGAYLFGTHRLPERLRVPVRERPVRGSGPGPEYRLAARYPAKSRSRSLAAGVLARLPRANPGFVTMLGVLHLLLMYAMANAAQRAVPDLERRLVTIPLGVMVVVVLGSALMFAMPANGARRRPRHWALGLGHGLSHLALGAGGTWIWLNLPVQELPWPLPELTAVAGYLPVVGLLAATVVGGYLLVASAFGVNVNELYAAQSIMDGKCFLRMHLGTDGALTVYPVAVDRVARRWTPNPDGPTGSPWLEPGAPLRYRLVEPPIRIE